MNWEDRDELYPTKITICTEVEIPSQCYECVGRFIEDKCYEIKPIVECINRNPNNDCKDFIQKQYDERS